MNVYAAWGATGLPMRVARVFVRAGLWPDDVRAMTDEEVLAVRQSGATTLAAVRAAMPRANSDVYTPDEWAALALEAEARGYGARRLSELPPLVASGVLPRPRGKRWV